MKRIVTVRHAKAVPYGYEEDFTRDLASRGEKDADKISRHLKSLAIIPDLMVSSPANRAWQTAQIFAENLGYPVQEINEERELYMEYTAREFLEFVIGLPDEVSTVFVFGHNPGMAFYTEILSRGFTGDMPTCSTVGIDFNITSWKDLKSRSGNVAFHFIPKMF